MNTRGVGHAVTEDYSSYESVDEEAPLPEKPAKGKGKKAAASIAVKDEGETDEKTATVSAKSTPAPALKRKPSKPTAQKGGIASYFSKK
jgi:hypothetical protein